MTTEVIIHDPKTQVKVGKMVLRELTAIVRSRKDKVMINGKQYLCFTDWQFIGAPFGITARVVETREITKDVPSEHIEGLMIKDVIGFWARAEAWQDSKLVSSAEAECLREESNWAKKDRFQLRSMAQTRACAKALRNCLGWVVKLPQEATAPVEFAEEAAEEIEQKGMF